MFTRQLPRLTNLIKSNTFSKHIRTNPSFTTQSSNNTTATIKLKKELRFKQLIIDALTNAGATQPAQVNRKFIAAQFNRGIMYQTGNGVKQSDKRALWCYVCQ